METTTANSSQFTSTPEPLYSKVISSFVGLEEKFSKFLETTEGNNVSAKVIKSILHVFIKNGKVFSLIVRGVELENTIKKLSYELNNIECELKNMGIVFINEWNSTNKENLISIRFVTMDNDNIDKSVLITTKNSYSINAEGLLKLKNKLGKYYSKMFSEKVVLSLKPENQKIVLEFLSKRFKKDVSEFVNQEMKLSVNHEEFSRIMNSGEISEDLKRMVKDVVVRHNPAIRYS